MIVRKSHVISLSALLLLDIEKFRAERRGFRTRIYTAIDRDDRRDESESHRESVVRILSTRRRCDLSICAENMRVYLVAWIRGDVFPREINRSLWQYRHRQGLLYKDGSTILTYSDDRRARSLSRSFFPVASGIPPTHSHLSFLPRWRWKVEEGGGVGDLERRISQKEAWNDRCAPYVKARISARYIFSQAECKRMTIGYRASSGQILGSIASSTTYWVFLSRHAK